MTDINVTSVIETLKDPTQYVKAILAAAVPLVGSLVVAYQDSRIDQGEWQTALGLAASAFVAVFLVKNSSAPSSTE